MENKTYTPMWNKIQLIEAMEKVGWQPGTVEGIFVHKKTLKDIDINERDSDGRIVWLTYALARMVPPPF